MRQESRSCLAVGLLYGPHHEAALIKCFCTSLPGTQPACYS